MDGTHAVPCSTAEVSESNSVIDSSDINGTEWDVLDRLEMMQPVTSESETDEDDLFSIGEELKIWANKFEIKQNALDDLLKILRGKGFEDVLPTCARTLLKTPRTVFNLKMPHVVVIFDDESEVESVPSSWVVKENDQERCYWPLKNQKRKIIREEIPDKKVWDLFDCRIVGKSEYKDYSDSVVAMKKAEVTSNLESSNEDSEKRSRKRPHRYAAKAEESSEDDKMFVQEKQPKLVQKKDEKINSQEKIPKTPLYKNGEKSGEPKTSIKEQLTAQGDQQNSNLERQLPSTSSGEGQRSSTSSGQTQIQSTSSGEGKRPSTSSGEGQGSSSSSGLLQMPSTSSGEGKRPSTSSIERTPDMENHEDLPVIDRPSSRLSHGDSAVMKQMQKDVTDIKKAVTTILNTLIVQEEVVVESVEDFIPEKIKNQEMMDQLNEQLESDEEFRKKTECIT
ncbi:uncharacterized protein LOC127732255 [Mytilus californianus]|uniref:uncharacterized protein LOC127732255 n=1 Tax=Mytilus californianus TaxID=6549 RepID=UPI002246E325|nr:uncharacterized protein LOC127732255 [Mytilus californianus]